MPAPQKCPRCNRYKASCWCSRLNKEDEEKRSRLLPSIPVPDLSDAFDAVSDAIGSFDTGSDW